MKLRHFYPCLLLAGMAVTVASCSEEATLTPGQGRNVTMTVNISRVGQDTRAVLTESEGNLACTWEDTDHILVVDANGNKLGVLSLTSGAGESNATFSGEITTDATGDTDLNFLYLGSKTEAELKDLSTPLTIDYSEQNGSLAWLSANDFFCGSANVNIANSYVNVTDVNLARQLAFGKFEMALPEGVTYGGETITVSGDGIYTLASVTSTGGCTFSKPKDGAEITVSPEAEADGKFSSSFYLTVLPTDGEQIEPTFSVTIDNTTYTCTLPKRLWKASEFVRLDTDGTYSGIKLEMNDPNGGSGEDEVDETELVGPVFEVNGQKFRFTRANLHYNVNNDEWYLPEKQIDYICQWGKYVNGGSHDVAVIDMFRWGATGLGNARPADFLKESSSDTSITISEKLPSTNSEYNSGLYDTADKSIKGFDYDWGKAYSSSGKYYTLTESEWMSVITNNYVVLGTITGIKDVNGNAVQGAILTDAENFETLKKDKNSSLKKLSLTSSNSNMSWTMVSLTYDELSKYNAVFFPAVGYQVPSSTRANKLTGRYWSSSVSTRTSNITNAIIWNFSGQTNSTVFLFEGNYKSYAMAVRLVRKVN